MKIIVEKLDFRSPELSKRMNRLIQNFGKRYVKEKLARLQQLYGIEIVASSPLLQVRASCFNEGSCLDIGIRTKYLGNQFPLHRRKFGAAYPYDLILGQVKPFFQNIDGRV
jgi:hypothetical protein